MSRCPYCGQKECCGADLSPKLDKLVEAAGFILEAEKHRAEYGHDEWYRDAQPMACDDLRKALREMGEDSHE